MALFDVPFSYYLTSDMTKSLVLHDKNNTVYMFVETYASTNYPGWDLSSTFHLVSGTFCSHAALPSAAPFQDLRLPIVVPSIQNSLWLLCKKVWLICDHYWLDQKALITAMLFKQKGNTGHPRIGNAEAMLLWVTMTMMTILCRVAMQQWMVRHCWN